MRAKPASPAATIRSLDQERERIRGWIAFTLFGLLAVVVLLAVVGLLIGRLSVVELKEVFASLGLLTTLVGTAMGFYFGRATR